MKCIWSSSSVNIFYWPYLFLYSNFPKVMRMETPAIHPIATYMAANKENNVYIHKESHNEYLQILVYNMVFTTSVQFIHVRTVLIFCTANISWFHKILNTCMTFFTPTPTPFFMNFISFTTTLPLPRLPSS